MKFNREVIFAGLFMLILCIMVFVGFSAMIDDVSTVNSNRAIAAAAQAPIPAPTATVIGNIDPAYLPGQYIISPNATTVATPPAPPSTMPASDTSSSDFKSIIAVFVLIVGVIVFIFRSRRDWHIRTF